MPEDPLYPYSAGVFGTGANFAFRRSSLLALDGFDEALSFKSLGFDSLSAIKLRNRLRDLTGVATLSSDANSLEKLVDYTGSAEYREFHPIKQAATVQHMFLQIFPFTEHSGKVGRMCTNLILLRNNYMPAVIHSIDRQKYYESFRGNVSGFRTLLMDAIENSLDNGIKYFKDLNRRYKAIN